jgi:D-alanyl-lipoteichoic acid acyltransferase DltB (MBOAT superfamily)
MVPQFRSLSSASWKDLTGGIQRIVWGLFMKIVIADSLANGTLSGQGVASGFEQINVAWSALDTLALSVGYGLQIFFDFAGYSHIAIGSAQLFGVRIRENFNDPYAATSPAEFWNRWHMSLSSWIRDYLYFPLAAIRPRVPGPAGAAIVSMTVFGIWHGLSANFAIWGLYHGLLLAAQRRIQKSFRSNRNQASAGKGPRLGKFFGWLTTFLLVTLGWILFRSPTWSQSFSMFESFLYPARPNTMESSFFELILTVFAGYFSWLLLKGLTTNFRATPQGKQVVGLLSPVLLIVMIVLILIFSDQSSPFVYVGF